MRSTRPNQQGLARNPLVPAGSLVNSVVLVQITCFRGELPKFRPVVSHVSELFKVESAGLGRCRAGFRAEEKICGNFSQTLEQTLLQITLSKALSLADVIERQT